MNDTLLITPQKFSPSAQMPGHIHKVRSCEESRDGSKKDKKGKKGKMAEILGFLPFFPFLSFLLLLSFP
jgi:hypothetical protein